LAGLGLGEQWGCLWANDFDPRKGDFFEANFGKGSIRVDDVSNVKASDLPETADLAWASFPCQDLSLAGWLRGMTAKHSGAFWEFWHIIREFKDDGRAPKLLAIENVVGLLYGDSFTGLCEALAPLPAHRLLFSQSNRRFPEKLIHTPCSDHSHFVLTLIGANLIISTSRVKLFVTNVHNGHFG
jgi:site-specific DNA-cytosine methylase